jgi:hypothetical protein
MFGSGREEDRLTGYLSFLKIGPQLLKFIPGGCLHFMVLCMPGFLCMLIHHDVNYGCQCVQHVCLSL